MQQIKRSKQMPTFILHATLFTATTPPKLVNICTPPSPLSPPLPPPCAAYPVLFTTVDHVTRRRSLNVHGADHDLDLLGNAVGVQHNRHRRATDVAGN